MQPIPVYLNNFNRLATVREMVRDLDRMGACVRIVDNASTLPPLLDWYAHDCPVQVIRLEENHGPRAPWAPGVMDEQEPGEVYCVCDCDLDLSACPDDLLSVLKGGLDWFPDVCKAGPSLEINDLPDAFPFRQRVLALEEKYWTDRRSSGFWNADIDTHFAMHRAGEAPCQYGPALRADRPYAARHLPWYYVPGQLSDEERFYIQSIPPHLKAGLYWSTLMQDHPEAIGS